MRKNRLIKMKKSLMALSIATALTVEAVAMPLCQSIQNEALGQNYSIELNSEHLASYVQQLNNLKVDYESHLNNSVMYKLPEGVGKDEEISVIIPIAEAMNIV